MSATIPPPIVQPGFGFGNLTWVQWLATGGLTGCATMEDIRDVCPKSSVFIDRPRHRDGDRRGDGADGRRAFAGSRRVGGPAGPPTSAPAPGSIIMVAAVRQPRRHLPASSAPVWRSPPPRTAAPIMTIMTAMAARSITAAGRSTAIPAITAVMAITAAVRPISTATGTTITITATGRACAVQAVSRSPAGNHVPPTDRPAGRAPAWPADFFVKQRWPLTRWPSVWISLRK